MIRVPGGLHRAAFVAALIVTTIQIEQAIPQTANSNAGLQGSQDGMFDAILATPNYMTPVLLDSAIATAPRPREGSPHSPVQAECSGPGPVQFKRSVFEFRRQQDLGGPPARSPRLG